MILVNISIREPLKTGLSKQDSIRQEVVLTSVVFFPVRSEKTEIYIPENTVHPGYIKTYTIYILSMEGYTRKPKEGFEKESRITP